VPVYSSPRLILKRLISEEKKIPVDLRQRQWFPADKDYRYIVKKGRKFLSKLADVAELRCHVERWKKEGHSIHLEATQANVSSSSDKQH